jgi:rhodanese-related sulfurtransferase
MDAATLKRKIASQEPIILLDVREPDEALAEPYFRVPPKTYLNLPSMLLLFASRDELRERIFGALHLPDTIPIIALCRSGGRSGRIVQELIRHGFHAENLEGGIVAWGEPVSSEAPQSLPLK